MSLLFFIFIVSIDTAVLTGLSVQNCPEISMMVYETVGPLSNFDQHNALLSGINFLLPV